MTKKPLAIMGASLIALSLLGCSAKSTTDVSAKDYSNQTVTGKVTAVSGDSVTLQLGEMTERKGGEAPSGDKDSKKEKSKNATSESPATSTATADDTMTATALSSTESSAAPSGDVPSGKEPSDKTGKSGEHGGGRMFTAGTETLTITVGSTAKITLEKRNATGSVSDIAVGDILEVTFGANSTVNSVTVKNFGWNKDNEGSNGGPGSGKAPGGDASGSSSKQP